MSFGLACCAIEMMSMSASRFDIARFGAEVFRGSPRQSDLMIIAGRVSNKMAPVIRHLYQQMPEPKWAISMGACATSTGVFNNYALIPVNQVIPVDVLRAGMPAAAGAIDLRADAAAAEDPGPERHREAGFEPRMNWNDAAEDFLNLVLAQTPRPVREDTEAQLRGAAEAMAEEDGKNRVGVETVIAAWVRSTPRPCAPICPARWSDSDSTRKSTGTCCKLGGACPTTARGNTHRAPALPPESETGRPASPPAAPALWGHRSTHGRPGTAPLDAFPG